MEEFIIITDVGTNFHHGHFQKAADFATESHFFIFCHLSIKRFCQKADFTIYLFLLSSAKRFFCTLLVCLGLAVGLVIRLNSHMGGPSPVWDVTLANGTTPAAKVNN